MHNIMSGSWKRFHPIHYPQKQKEKAGDTQGMAADGSRPTFPRDSESAFIAGTKGNKPQVAACKGEGD
jgi:hypothetical protein